MKTLHNPAEAAPITKRGDNIKNKRYFVIWGACEPLSQKAIKKSWVALTQHKTKGPVQRPPHAKSVDCGMGPKTAI